MTVTKTRHTITVSDGTEIFVKDWGTGQPIVFSHGWPLSSDAWEDQMFFLTSHGYRCIAHDRRGHGRSTQRTVLIDQRRGGVYLSYDLMASLLAPYENAQASAVARQLDDKVMALLTGAAE